MFDSSRGIRNKNPMNIRKGSTWLGLSHNSHLEKEFCVFTDVVYGLRAAMYLLSKYVFVYHCDTIRDIIYRWAPPSENLSSSYVDSVVRIWNLNLSDDVYIYSDYRISTKHDLLCLMIIMCGIESGYYLSNAYFEASFKLLPSKFQKLWKKQS